MAAAGGGTATTPESPEPPDPPEPPDRRSHLFLFMLSSILFFCLLLFFSARFSSSPSFDPRNRVSSTSQSLHLHCLSGEKISKAISDQISPETEQNLCSKFLRKVNSLAVVVTLSKRPHTPASASDLPRPSPEIHSPMHLSDLPAPPLLHRYGFTKTHPFLTVRFSTADTGSSTVVTVCSETHPPMSSSDQQNLTYLHRTYDPEEPARISHCSHAGTVYPLPTGKSTSSNFPTPAAHPRSSIRPNLYINPHRWAWANSKVGPTYSFTQLHLGPVVYLLVVKHKLISSSSLLRQYASNSILSMGLAQFHGNIGSISGFSNMQIIRLIDRPLGSRYLVIPASFTCNGLTRVIQLLTKDNSWPETHTASLVGNLGHMGSTHCVGIIGLFWLGKYHDQRELLFWLEKIYEQIPQRPINAKPGSNSTSELVKSPILSPPTPFNGNVFKRSASTALRAKNRVVRSSSSTEELGPSKEPQVVTYEYNPLSLLYLALSLIFIVVSNSLASSSLLILVIAL